MTPSNTRISRPRWLRSVSFLLLVPLLAMAGFNLASSARAQDAPTISMWFNSTGGSETADCLIATAIEPFNALGGVQVDATLQANSWDATRTAVAGGAGPDVVTTPGPSFGYALAEAGQVLSLDDYATQYGWSETFVPWALDLGRVNGELYSIPNEIETLVLYYNETLFQENGWTPPTTLTELMTLSETIAAAGIIPFAHANAEWRPTNEWFVGEFLNHHAGPEKVYQALSGEIPWTDPAFVEAITLLDQMQQNGWFMGGLDRYYTTTSADAAALMAEGEAAMKIEGTWFVTDALTFFRRALPGEVGIRNQLRGDGYFTIDMSIAKGFDVGISDYRLRFRWDIFNVTNTPKFNVGNLNMFPDRAGFVRYDGTLATCDAQAGRCMQFALRYEF